MFMIHNTVHEEGRECLDIKLYESLSRNEDALIAHTRVFRDEKGAFSERILFRRSAEAAHTDA